MQYITSSLLQSSTFHHGFFTRLGGVSGGLYASLNAGPGSGDDLAQVAENRARIREALGAAALCTAYQVHGNITHVIDAPWPPGQAKEGDALVTATPGLAIGVLTADCVPVLLADATAGVIGAAHAGWKGAAAGIIAATIAAMESCGATRANIRAAIGPAISQASYEVGADMRERYLSARPEAEACFIAGKQAGYYHFDLKADVAAQLGALGVANCEILHYDTYADEEAFFSFRRATHRGEPVYGRQLSAIMLTKK